MEIREFAQTLLFGATLAAKLHFPKELSDERPGGALDAAPERPGRPAALRFEQDRDRKRSYNLRNLETNENRACLLHHFANHEVLAIELMALALLQFPEAPAAFRASIVGSIREEQRHFRLYRARFQKLGFDFGDFPVNDFFWKHLAFPTAMRRPIDFAVRMGMTFEQANLDYMRHYAAVFGRLGDRTTVAVLDTVLRDEIGHVKNGVRWFEYFRQAEPAGASQWSAYRDLLPPGLSAIRARGFGYNVEARRAAGLTDEFIESLRIYAHSRGRPPALFWFNPACEEAAAARRASGFTEDRARPAALSKAVRMLEGDLEHVLLFLAGHEDAVLLRHRPGDEYLRALQAAGYEVPEIYEDPGERAGVSEPLTVPATLRERKLGDLRPWGRGPDSLARLGPLFAAVVGQRGVELRERGADEYLAMSDFYARPCALKIARAFVESRNVAGGDGGRLVAPGRACTDVADALGAVEELRANGAPSALLKAFFGTAGRNRLHWHFASSDNPPGAAPDDAPLIEWIERALARYGGVVVEAWFERVADYSVQMTVELDGAVTVHGVTRLFNDPAGRYRATLVGRIFDLLTPAQRRTLADPVQGIIPVLGDVARFAGRQLAARGYRGPAGIDAFAFRETSSLASSAASQDRPALRPLVEINPRYTMGRVALEIGKRVRAHRAALWCTITRRECRAAGFADFPALAAHFRDHWPLAFSGDLIDGGVLCTADPTRARERLTLLCVAPDAAGCLDQLAAAGLSFIDR